MIAVRLVRLIDDWLLSKSDAEIERRYREIGALWAAQNVSLAHVCWGLFLTKEYVWNFLQHEGFLRGRPRDFW